VEALEHDLTRLSPEDAARAQRNPRRVVRALEIWTRTGRSPATFPPTQPRYRFSKRRLEVAPAALEGAIAQRTKRCSAAGLVAEVAQLLARYPDPPTALQAIGYKEVRTLCRALAACPRRSARWRRRRCATPNGSAPGFAGSRRCRRCTPKTLRRGFWS
jgi:tRNA A37 N6-isopentenylltransferase MiaA